jgi:REP element-mobilizing transposase RayT
LRAGSPISPVTSGVTVIKMLTTPEWVEVVNHIHIITHIHPTKYPAYLVKDIKEASHVMICRERSLFQNFPGWQVGYSGFTYH